MNALAASKPKAVGVSVTILWCALAFGLITSTWRLSHTPLPVPSTLVYSMLVIVFALSAFFVYKISCGRNWARIVYLIFMLLGMFKTLPNLISIIKHAPFSGSLGAVVVVAQLVAMALLFVGSSNKWFEQREA